MTDEETQPKGDRPLDKKVTKEPSDKQSLSATTQDTESESTDVKSTKESDKSGKTGGKNA